MTSDLQYIPANLAKNLAAPVMIPLRRSRGSLGMDGSTELVLRTVGTFVRALVDTEVPLSGARVLELGPGRTPEVAASLALLGAAEVVGCDVTVQVPKGWQVRTEHLLSALVADEALLSAARATASQAHARAERFAADGWPVRFMRFDGRHIPLAEGFVDVAYSKSVLEHVAPRDVDPLVSDLYRVLRPGAAMVHAIDLRDHMFIDHDEVTGDWLRALRYSEPLFRAMFSKRSTAINRLRAPEWRVVFERNGFHVVGCDGRRYRLPDGFARERLQPRWRDLPEEVLAIGQLVVTLKRTCGAER